MIAYRIYADGAVVYEDDFAERDLASPYCDDYSEHKTPERLVCSCGSAQQIQDNLSAYKGEVVLTCLSCTHRHFNAQEVFTEEDLAYLTHKS